MNLNELRNLKWQAKSLINAVTIKGTALGESLKDLANQLAVTEHLAQMTGNAILYSDPKSDIWEEIKTERASQDKRWGGPQHDDTHTARDWCYFLITKTGKAMGLSFMSDDISARTWRKCMVQVAALAVAAIESYDRTHS
jgi:hypothetical protein